MTLHCQTQLQVALPDPIVFPAVFPAVFRHCPKKERMLGVTAAEGGGGGAELA